MSRINLPSEGKLSKESKEKLRRDCIREAHWLHQLSIGHIGQLVVMGNNHKRLVQFITQFKK